MVGGWIAWFAPIVACAGIVLFGRRSKAISAALALGGMAVAFFCSCQALLQSLSPHAQAIHSTVSWVQLPGLLLELGLYWDRPAILMSLVVTGVGLMIFIYSVGYMAQERGFPRYFAFLSLFAFSMMGIVLADNFVTLFMFWELVGASSYLLIGYWYERPAAAEAGKKAFLVNRIADFGFLAGILMVWNLSGLGGMEKTLSFPALAERIPLLIHSGVLDPQTLAIAVALIFCGVLGKSAQFPLHVWLPDAMEGPTPVSAMLHAATMVAAGVYLIGRTFFLFWESPAALQLVAGIGGITALFAASLALVENDIKRVLAFSTLSQLGYMVMALGLGGYLPGAYHLTTHAFFKALLFLGAGCAIHAVHTNDIWHMGGLLKKMPVTGWTFIVGSLALCGIFPLSGFWSKDEILALAFERNLLLAWTATLTAGMTAFYMGRVVSVAFLGKPRSSHAEHAHEMPLIMTGPMLVLAVFSVIGGFIGIPAYLSAGHAHLGIHPEFNMKVALLSSAVALFGLGLAFAVYVRGARPLQGVQNSLAGVRHLLVSKFYFDEIYGWINRNIQQRFAILTDLFERYIIIGLFVNGTAKITGWTGSLVRLLQTGRVQGYALLIVLGFNLLFYWVKQWAP